MSGGFMPSLLEPSRSNQQRYARDGKQLTLKLGCWAPPSRGKAGHQLKGIFDTKRDSGYDDEIAFRYHFPKQYRPIADALIGERIIYREPKRNRGRQAYVATAKVVRVQDDATSPGYAYAVMSEYREFDEPVPFVCDGRYWETALISIQDPTRVGAFLQGKSIRAIPENDFATIVRAGLSHTLMPDNAIRLELDPKHVDDPTRELLDLPIQEQERRIEQILLNRKIREASFRRKVCDAYDSRCAITGLRIVNGGGKSEAQAAHIWSVAEGGLMSSKMGSHFPPLSIGCSTGI